MYTKDHIELLNKFGVLSTLLLARKYRFGLLYSRKILNAIVQDYENVYFKNKNIIVIEGRELAPWKPKEKKTSKKKPPMTPRWKDVTKP